MKVVNTSHQSSLQTMMSSLQTEMSRLAAIAGALNSEGLAEEAQSLETTIADLEWQCEELSQRQPAQSR
ncbi:MAG: hypothetical protein ACRDU9_10810 [Acidimicrobiia bacterium]